jgi:hypothetical protein
MMKSHFKGRGVTLGVSAILVLVVFNYIVVLSSKTTNSPHSWPLADFFSSGYDSRLTPNSHWTFDSAVHANDYSLTPWQCSSAFPGLYAEIHRARNLRKLTYNLTLDNVIASTSQSGGVRFIIHHSHIYIVEDNSNVSRVRAVAILSAIQRAIVAVSAFETLPDIEVVLSVNDFATAPHQWALSREIELDHDTWVVPDFVFWAAPTSMQGEYENLRDRMQEEETPFDVKKPELVWRGTIGTSELRIGLKNSMEGKSWGNFKAIDWTQPGGVSAISDNTKEFALTVWEQCQWQYLAYTEGKSVRRP